MKHLILICCVVMMTANSQTTMEDDDATCQLEIMQVINSSIDSIVNVITENINATFDHLRKSMDGIESALQPDSIVDVITENINATFDHLNKRIDNINKRLDGSESALQPDSKECKPGWRLLGDSCYIIPSTHRVYT